jgi:predicted acyl esterase
MTDEILNGMRVERDLAVPTRDGIALASDVYQPPGAGPFPLLLGGGGPLRTAQRRFVIRRVFDNPMRVARVAAARGGR